MLDSVIRTVVPLIVGYLITQAAKLGINLDEGAVTEMAALAIGSLYYTLCRIVEQFSPRVGRFLLSLGLARTTPTYTPPAPPKLPTPRL